MPENWEDHKCTIEDLYLVQRKTLKEVREIMEAKHGFTSASRTYKMKLDEWKFHKNRRKKSQAYKESPTQSRKQLVYVPFAVSTLSSDTPVLTIDELCPSAKNSNTITDSLTSFPSEIHEFPLYSEHPLPSTPPTELLCQKSQAAIGWVTNDLSSPSMNLENIVVNTSLMFFSFRSHTESLHLLANSPELAQWAVEIVLRNWKPGGESTQYLLQFLENSDCCQSLLSYNTTRWTDSDETLFNLIDVELPEDAQVLTALTIAVLKADLKFQHPLPKLRPTWANQWRVALLQTEWILATRMVRLLVTEPCEVQLAPSRLQRDRRLVYCALLVIAESLLGRNRRILASWRGNIDIFFETARSQYFEILKDCRLWGIILDPTWYANLVVVNTIDHGTSCYFTSASTHLQEQQ